MSASPSNPIPRTLAVEDSGAGRPDVLLGQLRRPRRFVDPQHLFEILPGNQLMEIIFLAEVFARDPTPGSCATSRSRLTAAS